MERLRTGNRIENTGFAVVSILILFLVPFSPVIFLALLFFLLAADRIPAPSHPVPAAGQRSRFFSIHGRPLSRAPPC